jgi:ABC-type nitrate/sulfonate/bicarbonate transport system permease component
MKRFCARHERLLLGMLAIAVFLLLWEGVARGWWAGLLEPLLGPGAAALRVKPLFLSSPSAVAHIAASGMELAAGLLASILVGVPLGLVAGRNRILSYALEPFIAAFNATPQVAFLPLVVLWIGMGIGARVLVIFLLAVLPILLNAHAAVRTIDPGLLRVARSFGSSESHVLRAIILPGAMPLLLSGIRLAIGRGMIGIVVGELYGSALGIGVMISQAGATFVTSKVFVGVLTLVCAGLLLTELVRRLENRVSGWRAPIMQQTG